MLSFRLPSLYLSSVLIRAWQGEAWWRPSQGIIQIIYNAIATAVGLVRLLMHEEKSDFGFTLADMTVATGEGNELVW